ncbi:hypothetical protein FACS1894174_05470 [Bacteroidia bacterium]|nr:hypothetical protein FACS1894174_05470 [Bacteroidia bacterium]
MYELPGTGKLLICSSDLEERLKSRPVAGQLRYSLINYMQSEQFSQKEQIEFEQLEKYLYNKEKIEE